MATYLKGDNTRITAVSHQKLWRLIGSAIEFFNCQHRILTLVKISFVKKEEMKTFSGEAK
jgi:hypothetical protein